MIAKNTLKSVIHIGVGVVSSFNNRLRLRTRPLSSLVCQTLLLVWMSTALYRALFQSPHHFRCVILVWKDPN